MSDPEDRRLTGFRIPRFVDLDGPEAQARIRRTVEAFRARYPDPEGGLHRAAKTAVEMERLRGEGFSEADRAELLAWAERLAPPTRP